MAEPAPYLDGERLAELLPPRGALEAVQSFFRDHRRDAVTVPPRIHMRTPGPNTVGLYMPAATARYIGVKNVHLMPDLFPSVMAEIFLYDAETGRLLFWGDGKPMTGLRTAAVSAAASLRLMPACRSLLVFGAGVQAAAHLEAFASAYPELEEVWAVTRSQDSYRRLEESLAGKPRRMLQRCGEPAARLGEVDCVIATTPAPEPLFQWARLSPHCHVVGIGSATPEMNELPREAFTETRAWLDTRNALEEAGDLHAALRADWDESRLAGDLFDLLGPDFKSAPEGTEHKGRTVFKSVGHAAEDLAILIHLWEKLRGGEGGP